MSQMRFLKVLLAILALVICTGSLQATATLVANPTSLTLNCDTFSGPTAAPVGITLAAAGSALNVTVTASAGLSSASGGPVVLPSPAQLAVNSTTVATSFSFIIAPGCKGTVPGGTLQLTFTPTTGTALVVPVTLSIVTSHGSALVPSPSSLSFTCNKSNSTISPSGPQTINVTSQAMNGTPFTVTNASPNTFPAWLTLTSGAAGGTATGTAVAFVVTGVPGSSGCNALPSGTTTFNIHLANAPAADKLVTVTILVGSTSPLSSSVNPVAMTYVSGTPSSGYAADGKSANISSSSPAFFQVDLTTVPSWLSVSPTTGTTTSPVALTFQPAPGVAGLNLGNYTANVHFKVSNYLDFVLPVSIQVNNSAPTLSFLQGTSQTINWIIGTNLPTVTLTAVSSDAPIAFGVTTAGAIGPSASITNGLAYNFGTPFTVTFSASDFAAFAPGNSETGTVTLSQTGTANTVVFTITVKVQPQTALINSISPSILPTAASGSFTVTLNGSGFVTGSSATVVGIVPTGSSSILVVDNNVSAAVQNTTSIVVTIAVPSTTDPYLPFSGNGGSVTIGVCNPLSGSTICSSPTGTQTLTIGINPIISAVTSAASYIEVTAPSLPTIAPYDILSIFGTNFCVSGGTGCTSPNPLLIYGTPNTTTYGYPASLSPDPSGATQRNLVVTFYPHGNTTNAIATAPLLFASNGQINLLAPSALATHEGAVVDIIVSFGYGSGSTMLKSQPTSVNVAATDPGVFTLTGDGQGDAAALASVSYALISSSAPAIIRSNGPDSDTIQLYVTGLGVPDSTYTGALNSGGSGASATCMTAAAYWTDVQSATSASPAVTSDDGLVIQSSFIPNGYLEPCFLVAGTNIPTVTIGGQAAPVSWASWVAGAVAGLYQINVQLPSATPTLPLSNPAFTYASDNTTGHTVGTTFAAKLPIVVTAPNTGSTTSQAAGVNLWVLQGLLGTATGTGVTGPAGLPSNPVYTFTGVHGTALSGVAVVGTEGSASYTYAVDSNSTLPGDLTLNSDGTITGTPGSDMEGTTSVTFDITDANSLTGKVTINFVVS